MTNKVASILDYTHPGLDPLVWTSSGSLKKEHRKFLVDHLDTVLKAKSFKDPNSWITKLIIVGSLTTYQYVSDSDLDFHVGVDLEKFIEIENPAFTSEQAKEFLDNLRKEIEKPLLPGTGHPVEIYFETSPPASPETKSTYDLVTNAWIQNPTSISGDFDIEELEPFIIDAANEVAAEMDMQVGNIKRQIKRIEELQEVLTEWDAPTRGVFQEKLKKRLETIEQEIRDLIQTKDEVVERRQTYDPQGDDEIKFKFLQKFGYFYLISQLDNLFDRFQQSIPEEVVPELKQIVTQSSQQKEAKATYDYSCLMVAFPEEACLEIVTWGKENILEEDLYEGEGDEKDKYGREDKCHITVLYGLHTNKIEDVKEAITLTPVSVRFQEVSIFENEDKPYDVVKIDVKSDDLQKLNKDLRAKLKYTTEFPDYHPHLTIAYVKKGKGKKYKGQSLFEGTDWNLTTFIFSPAEGTKTILKVASEQKTLMVDFDDTIAKNDENHNIKEPLLGAKEGLTELISEGWRVVIYSCRANDPKGIQEIESFLETHNIPYTGIFMGKPHAEYYIDDKNIAFTSWEDVRKQIEKASGFTPSLISGPDITITDPDTVSDEETYHNPIVDKPKKDRWTKFLSLLVKKEAAKATEGWLSPQGKFYEVPFQSHDRFIYEHPDLFGDIKDARLAGSFEAMDRGWVRVGYYNRVLMFTSNNFFSVKQAADSWIHNHLDSVQEIELEFLDIDDDIHASKEDFLTKGWEAFGAEKYGSLGKQAHIQTDSVLIDPSGNVHQCGASHYGYILNNPKIFKPFGIRINFEDSPTGYERVLTRLVASGWIRGLISGKIMMLDATELSGAKKAETYIFDHINDINKIEVYTHPSNLTYTASSIDFKEMGWDAFSVEKHSSLEKEAANTTTAVGWILPNNTFVPLQYPSQEHIVNIVEDPKRYGLSAKDPLFLEMQDAVEEKHSIYAGIDVLLKAGFIRVAGVASGVLYMQLASFDQSFRTEDVIFNHLNNIKSIVIDAGTEAISAFAADFKQVGFDAFTKPLKVALKTAEVSREAAPPPPAVEDYKRTHIQPLGFTELMYFRENAPEEVQEEVEELIEVDKLEEAWVIIEKYLGRRHLRFGTRTDSNQELEPFTPLPVTYTHTTNEENLGTYPGRFMKRPSGEAYSNENEIVKMLVEKENLEIKADTCYTNQEMEEIFNKQHSYEDSSGGGNVYRDWNSSSNDVPKHPGTQPIFLDRLTPPPNNVMPSYEVTWYFGQPAEDNGSM